MLPFPDQTPNEIDNCEHLKGLPKGYLFYLHSKIQNPNRVGIKEGGGYCSEEKNRKSGYNSKINPRGIEYDEKTLNEF